MAIAHHYFTVINQKMKVNCLSAWLSFASITNQHTILTIEAINAENHKRKNTHEELTSYSKHSKATLKAS